MPIRKSFLAAATLCVMLFETRHGADSATLVVSAVMAPYYSKAECSVFICSLLERRKWYRSDKEKQASTFILEEGDNSVGLAIDDRFRTGSNSDMLNQEVGARLFGDIPGHLLPRSLGRDESVSRSTSSDVHPVDDAYDRLSQSLEYARSIESDKYFDYSNINYPQSEADTSNTRDSGISQGIPPKNRDTNLSRSKELPSLSEDDEMASWKKRNARSIDEGIRFKLQLREGLEEQTKIHREQLLSDLLQGVVGDRNIAFDSKSAAAAVKRDFTKPIRSWLSERFTKKTIENVADGAEETIGGSSMLSSSQSEISLQTEFPSSRGEKTSKREFFSRTIAGLIMALAEEAEGLEVNVDVEDDTPFWDKTLNSINVKFSRLGFRQMRFGGLDNVLNELEETLAPSERFSFARGLFRVGERPTTADEAFDRIDLDNSGSLDEEELAQALKMAAILGGNTFGARSNEVVADMASKLIRLYDSNGDGVVDRDEYRVLVQDMSALRDARLREEYHQQSSGNERKRSWFRRRRDVVSNSDVYDGIDDAFRDDKKIVDITNDDDFWESIENGEGSILFEDMRLDLRRLLFGLIPGMKKVLPGGPLILKPFTATVTASWNREDILNSVLIDIGLRRLVARALSRRVRGIRDLFDGAVFYGRTWKNLEQNAPQVEVEKLEDVQFDSRDRLIITGRARIKASPEAPSIENGFKLRTKIGTRGNGRIIGLLNPEIAIFAECPKGFENAVRTKCKQLFDYTIPRLEPLYTYIPLVSPLKKNDKMDGFNMGEDNQLKSIEIKNGKLCFEFSSVLRPGRFLGNHYVAFTVPNRTLILTLDRVKEAMRNARKNKRLAERAAREVQQLAEADSTYNAILTEESTGRITSISPEGKLRIRRLEAELKATIQDELVMREIEDSAKDTGKSFVSKFVEGYSGAIRQELDIEMNSRLSSSISTFFGSQERSGEGSRDDMKRETTK